MGTGLRFVRAIARTVAALSLPAALAGVFLIRATGAITPPDPQVGAGLSASDRLALAADSIEAVLGAGGMGFTFTVVQRTTLEARPGGPKIEIPDPTDRYKTLGYADSYYVGAVIAEGSATPDGFWLQMRRGPATPQDSPDFATAPVTLAALVKDGKTYRNNGDGWYLTDRPPGIGLDPATLALLPELLRTAGSPKLLDTDVVDGTTTTDLSGTGTVARAPGLMAIDAAAFTELVGPMEFTVDTYGRLVRIHALTRNQKQTIYDMLVDVVIELRYDTRPGLPDPEPALVPAAQS